MMDNAATRRALAMGMAGATTLATPTPALAAQAAIDSTSYATFALGCVTGAALAGAAAIVVDARSRKAEEEADAAARRAATTRGAKHGPRRRALGTDSVASAPTSYASQRQHAKAVSAEWEPEIRVQAVPQGSLHTSSADPSSAPTGHLRLQSMTEQMAVRAAGVRDTLRSRLGKGFFDDLPVIERADGSVGDVGKDWRDARLGRQGIKATGERGSEDTTPYSGIGTDLANVTTGRLDRASRRPQGGTFDSPNPMVATTRRSARIASRLAGLDLDVFPERRPSEAPDHADTFDQALAAMDERMGNRANLPPLMGVLPLVPDVGSAASDMAPAAAGTREESSKVDADSWLDSVAVEWSASNKSRAGYQSTESFLVVIQGGKGRASRPVPGRPASADGQTGASRGGGRHFAPVRAAMML